MQRGSTLGIFLAVFGILVVTVWGGYRLFKVDNPPPAQQPLIDTPPGEKNVRATRSFVILDNSFSANGGYVYYRSGVDREGEPTYSIMPHADARTFQKIGSATPPTGGSAASGGTAGGGTGGSQSLLGSVPASSLPASQPIPAAGPTPLGSAGTSGGGAAYSVVYYSDADTVYMVVESGGQTTAPQIVVGADPQSFQILNAEYSKDSEHVYVINVTCSGGVCTGTVSIVISADPDTFQAFPNPQNVLNSDCSGYVVADGQDANNVYNNGQIVDGISVYLIGSGGNCDDTPVLISP